MMADGLQRGFVMDRITIDLKNCYGIKALKKDFAFSKKHPAYAIYAPNGVMKSSLAQTFQDASTGTDSADRIFPGRKTSRRIIDETGADIAGERVLVVLPYDPEFGPTEKTSTLLVDAKLRKEHEDLQIAVDQAKEARLKAIRQQSGAKKNFEQEISSAITRSENKFEDAVIRIQKEIERQKDAPFAEVQYDTIFNDKVEKALEAKDVKGAIEDYIRRYNELLAGSTYFRKGTFDYYNAGQISKSLADNGFFTAKHTVNLRGGGGVLEITTEKELQAIIAHEKEQILTDKELRAKFNGVEKALQRNAELREFCHLT
jgi:hypothetical protein